MAPSPSADVSRIPGQAAALSAPSSTTAEIVALIDQTDSAALEQLLKDTKLEADRFLSAFRTSDAYRPAAELEHALNAWFLGEGAATCSALAEAVIAPLLLCSSEGHPGHDRRHVLYKDPLSALRHCVDDRISDYRSIFLLGALMHDVGRLPEPHIYGQPASGVAGADHQYLGYAILKRILEKFPTVPAEISNALLFSVLVHQAGTDKECFAAQFVQRADREQLVGPEFIIRGLGANVGSGRLDFAIPTDTALHLPIVGKADERHIATHIEFYARNLFPNVGATADRYTTLLKGMSMQFLALAYGPENDAVLFGPERKAVEESASPFTGPKPALPDTVIRWINDVENAHLVETSARSGNGLSALEAASTSLNELLTTRCAADPRQHKSNALDPSSRTYAENIQAALLHCSEPQLLRWDHAFRYARVCRDYLDRQDQAVLLSARALFRNPQSVGAKIVALVERVSGLSQH